MSEKLELNTPDQIPQEGFIQAGNGLFLPAGQEYTVSPAESALNNAMHIGMEEQGLGSVKYAVDAKKEAQIEKNEAAYDEILDPRNVIELKELIDNKVNKRNSEESHLWNSKDGSKQAAEEASLNEIKDQLVAEYLHVGDSENEREIPELVKSSLDDLLSKSYEELEEMGVKRAQSTPKAAQTEKDKDSFSDEHRQEKRSRAEILRDLMKESSAIDTKRIKGEKLTKEEAQKLKDNDEQVSKILMEQYGTDDPDDPRVLKARDFLEAYESEMTKKATQPNEAEGAKSEKERGESIQDIIDRIAKKELSVDPDKKASIKEDFEKIQKIQEQNINRELDRRGITDPQERQRRFNQAKKASNKNIMSTLEEAKKRLHDAEASDKSPKTKAPASKAPTRPVRANGDSTPRVVEASNNTPEARRSNKLRRKIGAITLAAVTLIGGYVGGRVNENRLIKAGDTPVVDEINKLQDHQRNLPVDAQEYIASNYQKSQEFFEAVSTPEGKANFEAMTKSFDSQVEKAMKEHGISKEEAEKLVSSQMDSYFAALKASKVKGTLLGK